MPIDYSKYPPNWKSEIVPRILKRAGNSCELCGLSNGVTVSSIPVYVRVNGRYSMRRIWCRDSGDVRRLSSISCGKETFPKVVLTIAHHDHDELNLEVSDDRLMALCQHCHLNLDSKEKYRRACGKEE